MKHVINFKIIIQQETLTDLLNSPKNPEIHLETNKKLFNY